MMYDEVDYEVFGDDMQILQKELDPGKTVIAEALELIREPSV